MADLLSSQVRKRKFQQREIDLDQLTDEELCGRFRFDPESITFLVDGNVKRRSPKADEKKPCAVANFRANFFLEALKHVVEKLVKPFFFLALIWD